jgi:predicted phosphate transport protein (TIGR00153 family)
MLESQAQFCNLEAQQFHAMVTDFPRAAEYAQKGRELEHDADALIRKVITRVDATFVTPLDKEDLHVLASRLDDVTDAIESAVSRLVLYHVDEPRSDMAHLTQILVRITEALVTAVSQLEKIHERDKMQKALENVHHIEEEGDEAFRSALADLFTAPVSEAITVIKWKDIYERTEKAIDRCNTVAITLENIMVKYA